MYSKSYKIPLFKSPLLSKLVLLFTNLKHLLIDTYSSKTLRPWGEYKVLYESSHIKIKLLKIKPKGQLSFQYHNHRSEHWTVISGKANVKLDDNEFELNVDQSIFVPIKSKHSIENKTLSNVEILEIQKGSVLLESDIVRLKDIYHR